MRFSDIYGQDEIKQKLIAAVKDNHLAHALLFSGKEGAVNLPLALALATYIQCENQTETDACGQCAACLKNAKYIHPDLCFALPVTGEKKTTQDFLKEWRAFLLSNPNGNLIDWAATFGAENKLLNISREEGRKIIQNLSLKSFESPYKIVLIWLAERLNAATANGLLKILEEPPPNTYFLLVSNDDEKLLTTILSRTQKVQVPLYHDNEISAILKEKEEISDLKISEIVQLADGNLRKAIELSKEVPDDNHAFFVEWMRAAYGFKLTELMAKAEAFNQMSKVNQQHLLAHALNMFRETMIKLASVSNLQRVNAEAEAFITNFSKTMNPDKIEKISMLLNEASYHLERNINPRIIMADVSFKIGAVMKSS